MKNQLTVFSLVATGMLLLNGCVSVGPNYVEPTSEMPDEWNQAIKDEFAADKPVTQNWWTLFGDETLNTLIDKATTNNLDLQSAMARIEQARALRGIEAGAFLPSFDAGGAASAVRGYSDNDGGEYYQAGVGMAWELDLWGRIRRSVESADATLQATEENYRDLMVLLYAEVASNYIRTRTLQTRIALAENNLEAQKETATLTNNRFDAGLVPSLDVAQAKLNLSRTASVIPPLRRELITAINRLSVLTGDMPGSLDALLNQKATIPSAPQMAMIGLPSDLLRQRPDIRRAERSLAAQNARIGVAKADFYPTLTLPGTLALETTSLGGGANTVYSFGPQLRWNLFAGGRIRNNVRAEEAATKAALSDYEQTLLLAVEETENTMASVAYEKDRVIHLDDAADSAKESVERVSELYKSGLTDFQNVLNMEQALLSQQDQLATSQGQVSIYLVQLYKALGGGWNTQQNVTVE